MFTPTLRALRKALPQSQIDVLIGTPATVQIVRQYPEISQIRNMDVRASLWSVVQAALRARSAGYDILVITDGVRGWKAKLFALLSGIGTVILPLPPSTGIHADHRVLRNLRALSKLGLETALEIQPYLANSWGPPIKGSVLIHPGCDGIHSFKRWPAERFASLATRLSDEGCTVTIVLGPSELELEDLFRKEASKSLITVFANKPFVEVLLQLARHEICITSDSGLGHVAAALGRRVVTIFGPANHDVIRPFSESAVTIRASDQSLTCRPCIRLGGRMGCPERPCLTQIEVEQVFTTVMSALAPHVSSGPEFA
jgi:ADP-heptose:LPS heptosyltransferase